MSCFSSLSFLSVLLRKKNNGCVNAGRFCFASPPPHSLISVLVEIIPSHAVSGKGQKRKEKRPPFRSDAWTAPASVLRQCYCTFQAFVRDIRHSRMLKKKKKASKTLDAPLPHLSMGNQGPSQATMIGSSGTMV